MAEKDKGALTGFEVEIAKNGFEIRARYAPKNPRASGVGGRTRGQSGTK